TSLLVLVKGLPLAYNRDLQEDKERLFDSADTATACLEMAAALVAGAELHRACIAERLDPRFLEPTTLLVVLTVRGCARRAGHEIIGCLLGSARRQNARLAELPLADFQAAHASLDESVYGVLGVDRAVAAFTSEGSTAPTEVAKQVAAWKKRLKL